MLITAFIVANLPCLHLFLFGNNNFAHVAFSFVYTDGIAQGIILEFALQEPCICITTYSLPSLALLMFLRSIDKKQQKTIQAKKSKAFLYFLKH